MALFDREDDNPDEVRIRDPREEESEEGKLKQEAEARLTDRQEKEADSSSSSGIGSSLPGMSSSGGSGTGGVELQDIYDQNERIIGLLEDIRSELDTGGGGNQLL